MTSRCGVSPPVLWFRPGSRRGFWTIFRRTSIETTSGLGERLMHSIMMVESLPVILGALFLEINAGALAWMIGLSVAHELTVLCDLWFTTPRRAIPAGEQVTHTLLEAPPFVVAAAAVVAHWDQFLALVGHRRGRGRFTLRLQLPTIPMRQAMAIVAALGIMGGLPHIDELWRCLQARRAGLTGRHTPECLSTLYS